MMEYGQRKVKIPVTARLLSVDKERAKAIGDMISTPEEAEYLRQKEGEPWAVRTLDGLGRVKALTYKGAEIRLFFKRQTAELILDKDAPDPEPVIKDPRKEWVTMDMVDQVNTVLQDREGLEQFSDLLHENVQLKSFLQATKERLEGEKIQALEEAAQYKMLAEAAAAKIETLEIQNKTLGQDLISIKRRTEQRALALAETGTQKVLRGLLPVLTALYQQKDKEVWVGMLFAIAQKVVQELGGELVIPQEGESFDPRVHYAVEVLEMDQASEGKVVAVSSLGVKIQGGVLIESAQVAVATYTPPSPVEDISGQEVAE